MSEKFDINTISQPEDISEIIYNLMVNPNLSPLNYFNDFTAPEPDPEKGDSDLISIDMGEALSDNSGLVMTTHAFSHHLENDPKKATEILVARAARKLICHGATPIAMNALLYHINFIDPNGQEMTEGVNYGFAEASKKFGIQLTDCKIRYDYFEDHGETLPTIVLSMIGSLKKEEGELICVTPSFKRKGNNIFVLGRVSEDICSSEYLEFYHGITRSPLPEFDLKFEVKLHKVMKDLISKNLIESANPIGKGGLFFTLLRAGWQNGLGFDITTAAEAREDAFLFGEGMGRLMVGVHPDLEDDFVDLLTDNEVPFFALGHVTKGEIRIDDESFGYINKMSKNL